MGFERRLGLASHKQHLVASVCALSGRGRIPCSPVAVPLSHRFLLARRQLPPESRAALRSIRMTHPAVSLERQFAPLKERTDTPDSMQIYPLRGRTHLLNRHLPAKTLFSQAPWLFKEKFPPIDYLGLDPLGHESC